MRNEKRSRVRKSLINTLFSRKFALFLFIFFASVFYLPAISFQDINLSSDDRFIFRADFESYHTIFVSQLADMSMRQLTAYPEKLYMVDNGRTIITLSRFGAVSIPAAGGIPVTVPGYPSFTNGNLPLSGSLQDLVVSSDGKWVLYLEPISPGYGNLFLAEISSGAKRLVSEKVELPGADFPAKWSPDSRYFVYSKDGRLFYYPVISNLSTLADERFRMIGSGGINSVSWGRQGDFYYLTENTLYRVINPELFTRTMYGDFLSVGNAVSILPINFDAGFDRYWIAPDSASILINKGGRWLFIFMLQKNQIAPAVLPHIPLPYGAENFNVYWSASGLLTILYSERDETKIIRIEIKDNRIRSTEQTTAPLSAIGALSPDETKAIYWGERGLEVWDYTEWRRIQRLSETAVLSSAWANNRLVITGNSRFIEEINISTPSFQRRRISLSGAEEIGFEDARGISRILARVGTTWFATDGTTPWTVVSNVQIRPISFSSERFRVFLEPQNQGRLKNIPMLRNLQSLGSVSIVGKHTTNPAYTPEPMTAASRLRSPQGQLSRQPLSGQLLTGGQLVQTALCFDVYDDDTGLMQVLTALRRLNIRATFFLNGEFIRRSPRAARAITEAGHEAASMFYAPIDLSDTRYRITQSFITQGLARNEDEFNHATGRELSVIWHPPFYRGTDFINSAAAVSGYITAARSIDPGDWLSREDSLRLNMRQTPPSEIIEQIIKQNYNGAVIPVRLGTLPGGRDEYLFQRIEALLDALIRTGCEIVPVSAVISR